MGIITVIDISQFIYTCRLFYIQEILCWRIITVHRGNYEAECTHHPHQVTILHLISKHLNTFLWFSRFFISIFLYFSQPDILDSFPVRWWQTSLTYFRISYEWDLRRRESHKSEPNEVKTWFSKYVWDYFFV